MQRLRLQVLWLLPATLLAFFGVPVIPGSATVSPGKTALPATEQAVSPAPDNQPPAPLPGKSVGQIFQSGVVITISLPSQTMHVFRDGVLWGSSPVSTGKSGKRTPTGTFAILQKKRFHRSNLYSNAPMPFMQRLTWSGIAIHAGHLPGYPASHGCIRLPAAFAGKLFELTQMASTAVVIVDQPLKDEAEATALAMGSDTRVPINPALLQREAAALAQKPADTTVRPPAARTIPLPPSPEGPRPGVVPGGPALVSGYQTIQLAALPSSRLAAAHWANLAANRTELRGMQMAIVPAVVKGTQYYRLRASSPDAHARCRSLRRAGIECFPVS